MEPYENNTQKGMAIQIKELNEVVRQYHDKDKTRFLKISKEIILDHLENSSYQRPNEVKNITINIYTL